MPKRAPSLRNRTAELVEQAHNAPLADALPGPITGPEDKWECSYYSVRCVCQGQGAKLSKAA